ncbi:MAG TPA: glucose 1-dehydrogenase [Bryobacteraceae bacterium]|nr:glucose 1-dehydrogenase [Bryobacteraceae bacterium]
MKAVAVFPRHKKIELIDHPQPDALSDRQVKIRILDIGVCGTDREIAMYEYGVPPEGYDYLILGHESLGQVAEIGRAVTNVKVGDLVVPNVRRPCAAHCPACAAGRQDFCYTGRYIERGILGAHGFLTEYIVEAASNLNLVPAGLRDVAVLAEPLTVTEKAFDQIAAIQTRLPWLQKANIRQPRALVLGAGPVGLLAAMKFLSEGYRVWIYSRGSEKDKPPIAAAIGAHFVDAEQAPPADLPHVLPGEIDIVYEAMGAADVAFAILAELGRNGIFVFTGIPRRSHPVAIDTSALLYNLVLKNQVILGTVNAAPVHFQTAIADLTRFESKFPGVLKKLISNRYPIEQFAEPLSHNAGIKNVIAVVAQVLG